MNDPHVVALFYNIEHPASVVYREEEPRDYKEENFSVRIENKKVCFTMKAHYATEEEARKAVEEYIQIWEIHAGLRRGPRVFKLVYWKPKIEYRNVESGHHVGAPNPVFWQFTTSQPTGTLTTSYPPPPQSGMKITPDVKSMYDRLMGHILGKEPGKEPLASMAYFCLTVLEISARDRCKKAKDAGPKSSKGEMYGVELASVVCPQVVPTWRATAAEMYGIERAVLKKIGYLSSEKGARKAGGQEALKDPEDRFLKEAIKALIYRAAEVAYGPVSRLPEIKLTDLPKLPKS